MVLELCSSNLYQTLYETQNEISSEMKTKLLIHITTALEYIHTRSPAIVHRDIKPQNVLLTNKFKAKLCDFGLAEYESSSIQNQGGTPNYMAPELFNTNKTGTIDTSSDIFALGTLCWEVFMNQIPFGNFTSSEIANLIKKNKRLSLDNVCFITNPELKNIISNSWKSNMKERPTANDFKNYFVSTKLNNLSTKPETKIEEKDCLDDLAISMNFRRKK